MLNRYLDDKVELDIKQRTGSKFLKCSQDIYLEVINEHIKHVKVDQELRDLKLAIDDLIRVYQLYEGGRLAYVIPDSLHANYVYAYNHYVSIKNYPTSFYRKENELRESLVRDRIKLASQISVKEGELERAEVEQHLALQALHVSLTQELATLNARKKRYLRQRTAANRRYFPLCYKQHEKMLPIVSNRIDEIELELKGLDKQRSSNVDELEHQLSGMQARIREIDKSLLKLEDKPHLRMLRWQNEISKAAVECDVRCMDVEAGLHRYYSAYPQQVIYYFLKVYALAGALHRKVSSASNITKKSYELLSEYADQIYCPELVNKSVKIFAAKLASLNEMERLRVLEYKPVSNHLPEELLRTFSISNLRDSTDLLKLFKGYFPPNPLSNHKNIAYSPRRKISH